MGLLLRPTLRRPELLAAVVLLCLPFAMFWPLWWPDAPLRQAFAYGDFVEQYYPMRAFVAGEWRQGHLPLWDPYTYAGTPAAAASLFAAFYPLSLWQTLFTPPFPLEALQIEAIFHLGLAGVFTMLLVRRLTGHTSAGLISGIAFGVGGFLVSYPVLQLGILETAVWLPAGLWLLEIGLSERDLRWVALAGGACALAILAGHPQTFLYAAYVTAAYLIFRSWRLRLPWRCVLRSSLVLGGVAAGLSAVQWLPSLELARLSPRAQLSYAEVSNGLTPAELWGLLRPNPGQWSPLYVGWVPLALVAAGLFLGRRAERWFWLATGAAALLLSLGRNGFLYPLAHAAAPGFAAFRNQERAAFIVSFALALLAGYGYAGLLRLRPWPALLPAVLPAVLALLTFVDLYRAGFGLVLQPAPTGGYFPNTPLVRHLQGTGGPDWRTSSEGLLPGDGNAGLVYRLRDVSGNSPLHLAHYDRFLAAVPESRFWQLLNVQHLLTRRQLDHGALKLVLSEDDRHLYQVFVQAKPAWIVHEYRAATDIAAALNLTADPALDPMTSAVLEQAPNPLPITADGSEDIRLVEFRVQRISADVVLSTPGLVVFSEVAYPGWKVRVNGQPAVPLRAYGLLRAVALPAGRWHVEWRYEPTSVRLGLLVSSLALVAAAFFQLRRLRQAHG